MKKITIGCVVIMFLTLFGCSGDKWEGIAFPDKAKLLIHYKAGKFESLEACEKECMALLESKNALSKGFYECGKNCDEGSNYYNRSCEELIRGNIYK